MMARYSSKEQEQYAQTKRVKVLGLWDYVGYAHKLTGWEVYVVDVATHEHEKASPTRRYYSFTKAEALEYAKEYAVAHCLPFDLQHDVHKRPEPVLYGPQETCVGCGRIERERYSREAYLCKKCRAAIAARSQGEDTEFQVDRRLLPTRPRLRIRHDDDDRMNTQLVGLLAVLTKNTEAISVDIHTSRGSYIGYYAKIAYHSHGQLWQLSAEQGAALQELAGPGGLLETYGMTCYQEGRRAGSDLLGRLASGEIHPGTFQLERDDMVGAKDED